MMCKFYKCLLHRQEMLPFKYGNPSHGIDNWNIGSFLLYSVFSILFNNNNILKKEPRFQLSVPRLR